MAELLDHDQWNQWKSEAVMTHIDLTRGQAIAGAVAASVLASTAGAAEGEPKTLTRRRLKIGMSGFPRSFDPVIATDTAIAGPCRSVWKR